MKMPPEEKILEAYSAIADNRIQLYTDHAIVESSDHSKQYTVFWKDNMFASTDNGTYWQGYPGYPVLAVLLLKGKLTLREELIDQMKGIPWKKLNDAYKRDYKAAATEALKDIEDRERILKYAAENNAELSALDLVIKRKLPKEAQ